MSVHAELLPSCPTLCGPGGLQPSRLPCPWRSPGKNTGVGCHALPQGCCADHIKKEPSGHEPGVWKRLHVPAPLPLTCVCMQSPPHLSVILPSTSSRIRMCSCMIIEANLPLGQPTDHLASDFQSGCWRTRRQSCLVKSPDEG